MISGIHLFYQLGPTTDHPCGTQFGYAHQAKYAFIANQIPLKVTGFNRLLTRTQRELEYRNGSGSEGVRKYINILLLLTKHLQMEVSNEPAIWDIWR